jgi:hypothetical protein
MSSNLKLVAFQHKKLMLKIWLLYQPQTCDILAKKAPMGPLQAPFTDIFIFARP